MTASTRAFQRCVARAQQMSVHVSIHTGAFSQLADVGRARVLGMHIEICTAVRWACAHGTAGKLSSRRPFFFEYRRAYARAKAMPSAMTDTT